MNRREFLSLIAAAPLAATLAPLRAGVIPMTYVGVEDIDGIDYHEWLIAAQHMMTESALTPQDEWPTLAESGAEARRRYAIIYGSLNGRSL